LKVSFFRVQFQEPTVVVVKKEGYVEEEEEK